MSDFVDARRGQIVEALVERMATGSALSLFHVSSPPGWGKTRILQEFYEELAAAQEVPYWPTISNGDGRSGDNSALAPVIVRDVAHRVPSYLWLGASGSLAAPIYGEGSLPAPAWQELQRQFHAHAGSILGASESLLDRESVLAIATALVDLLPLPNALSLVDSWGSALAGVGGPLRKRLEARRRRDSALLEDVVRVSGGGQGEPVAEQFAEVVANTVNAAGIPIALVIDNAHWADEGTVAVVRRLLSGAVKGVVVVASTPGGGDFTKDPPFSGLVRDMEQRAAVPFTRFALRPIARGEMRRLIRWLAPALSRPDEDRLVDSTAGNPLLLKAILELPAVWGPASRGESVPARFLDTLPRNMEDLYARMWGELPTAAQSALAVATVQGREFTPDWFSGWNRALAMALRDADDDFGWVRLEQKLAVFRESGLYTVAKAAADREQDPALMESGRRAFLRFADEEIASGAVNGWPPRARRVLLDGYTRLWLADARPELRSGPQAALALAHLMAEEGNHQGCRSLLGRMSVEAVGHGDKLRYLMLAARVEAELGDVERALALLERVADECPPRSPEYSAIVRCQRLRLQAELGRPQLQEGAQSLIDDCILDGELPQDVLAEVAVVTAQLLTDVGQSRRAIEQIKTIREAVSGLVDDISAMTLDHHLAVAFANDSEFEEARRLWEQLLRSLEETRFMRSPEAAALHTSVASWFPVIGRHLVGIQLMREAANRSEIVFGRAHPRTITARQNLGYWLVEGGEIGEGIAFLRAAAADAQVTMHEGSRRRLNLMKNVARGLHRAGDTAEAVQMLMALEHAQVTGGREGDAATAGIRLELSTVLAASGRQAEAVRFAGMALGARRRQLGAMSWRTRKAALRMAHLLDADDAIACLEEFRSTPDPRASDVTALEIEAHLAWRRCELPALRGLRQTQELLFGAAHRATTKTDDYIRDLVNRNAPDADEPATFTRGQVDASDHHHVRVGIEVAGALMGFMPDEHVVAFLSLAEARGRADDVAVEIRAEQEGRGHVVTTTRGSRRLRLAWEDDYPRGRVIEVVGCSASHDGEADSAGQNAHP